MRKRPAGESPADLFRVIGSVEQSSGTSVHVFGLRRVGQSTVFRRGRNSGRRNRSRGSVATGRSAAGGATASGTAGVVRSRSTARRSRSAAGGNRGTDRTARGSRSGVSRSRAAVRNRSRAAVGSRSTAAAVLRLTNLHSTIAAATVVAAATARNNRSRTTAVILAAEETGVSGADRQKQRHSCRHQTTNHFSSPYLNTVSVTLDPPDVHREGIVALSIPRWCRSREAAVLRSVDRNNFSDNGG